MTTNPTDPKIFTTDRNLTDEFMIRADVQKQVAKFCKTPRQWCKTNNPLIYIKDLNNNVEKRFYYNHGWDGEQLQLFELGKGL